MSTFEDAMMWKRNLLRKNHSHTHSKMCCVLSFETLMMMNSTRKKYDTRRYIREIRHRTYAAHFSNTIFFLLFFSFHDFFFFSTLLFFCCFFPFLHCKVLFIVSLFNLFSWFYYWVRYFKLSHLFLFSLHVLIDLQIVEMLHNGVEWEKKMKKNEEEMNRKKIALMARFMFDSKTEWIYCWLLFM